MAKSGWYGFGYSAVHYMSTMCWKDSRILVNSTYSFAWMHAANTLPPKSPLLMRHNWIPRPNTNTIFLYIYTLHSYGNLLYTYRHSFTKMNSENGSSRSKKKNRKLLLSRPLWMPRWCRMSKLITTFLWTQIAENFSVFAENSFSLCVSTANPINLK